MKRIARLLSVSMLGSMLLVGCGEIEDVNEELPDVEEPADPIDPELDENTEEDMDE